MSSKRLLLVGNAQHQFILEYVKWLKKVEPKIIIDVLSDRAFPNNSDHPYDNVHIVNVHTKFYSVVQRIPILKNIYHWVKYRHIIRKTKNYDYIHIHFLSIYASYFLSKVKKFSNAKLFISIWGSDFYHHYLKDKRLFENAIKAADKITFTNEELRIIFSDRFSWQSDNLKICRFGLAPLELLNNMKLSKQEAKKKLLLNVNKLHITIGYNLSPNQQHIAILKEIKKLRKYYAQIELLIPITYGGSENYRQEIIKYLKYLDIDYKIYDQYLSNEDVAFIRKASDIMIQLQKTDQFSGSMQEHMFARNVVITGSWLPYETFKKNDIYFIEITDFSEISTVLHTILNDYNSFYKQTIPNPLSIFELSSWETNIQDWVQLYD
jgi:hypothetical protein